jgi:hypothetical protein
MSIKSIIAKQFSKYLFYKTQKWANNPIYTQQKVFQQLIFQAKNTFFGKKHSFKSILTYHDFVKNVPIRDYEDLKPYIDQVVAGQRDILWKGIPIYFAKTSGTTSGAKYIPITKDSMPTHIQSARNAILSYIHETGNANFVNGKMIFLQGSPILEAKNGIKVGRLSGIVAHYVPKYLQKNRMPSWKTNCIEDWETKVNAIVSETFNQKMTVISGIPSWVQMYFEKLQEKETALAIMEQRKSKPIGEIFKDFSLFIYGGVNYEPYKSKFESLIGRKVASIELFPASEGFFAYQDSQTEKGMLLLLNAGIFYEFIKTDDFFQENPKRYTIGEVALQTNYVLIISTNAGLWAYNTGDTIEFTSLKPYRIIVSGRIKHYISAFGEHVIGKEVEIALSEAIKHTNASINEFTVAPQINPKSGLPYHEWFIEFEKEPKCLDEFMEKIEKSMRTQNIYYNDLIVGKVLQSLKVTKVSKNAFQNYMKSIGKLGGQNKIPRLSNDRKIVDLLQ